MKLFHPFILATILLVALITTVAAQDDEGYQLAAEEMPWGMQIVFSAGTTITEANALRLEHGLQIMTASYLGHDGRRFSYGYDDDSQYDRFARFYWGDTDHTGCSSLPDAAQPCPPIEPIRAWYDPVSDQLAETLLADERVAHIDNHNNTGFFLTQLVTGFFESIRLRWLSPMNPNSTGPME